MNNLKLSFKRLLLVLVLVTCSLGGVFAMECEPILVFDRTDSGWIVTKKFRANYGLNASASGQFSAQELEQLFEAIPVAKKNVWIIDLRQESHGFINGVPKSWYTYRNTANFDKSAAQILRLEKNLLAQFRKQPEVQVYELKKSSDGAALGENPSTFHTMLVQSEQQLVQTKGAQYKRFYVLDHHKPSDITVDQFISFIKDQVQADDWVHFHCRGGKGRSSTFIAMYDMILNAHNTKFDDIIKRQVEMGNIRLDLTSINAEKLWKLDASTDRYKFLKQFYTYVVDPVGYAKHSWSAWQKQHATK
jgi:hypothetical protein